MHSPDIHSVPAINNGELVNIDYAMSCPACGSTSPRWADPIHFADDAADMVLHQATCQCCGSTRTHYMIIDGEEV